MGEDYPRTLMELEQRFADDEACRQYLFGLRWPQGFACSACGGKDVWKGSRNRLLCTSCRRQGAQRDQPRGEHLLPRAHRVISLFKRWLMGTHQGAIGHDHLDDYLNEFVFRFNRRKSASRGKLFFRLAQQAVQVAPVPYATLVTPQHVGVVASSK